VLRELVFVHAGWDSDFTELYDVLHKIEEDFEDKTKGIVEGRIISNRTKLDIPDSPLEPPANHGDYDV